MYALNNICLMKKWFALILVVITLCMTASAETAFDPSQYTMDELKEINNIIMSKLLKTEKGDVIYDKDGVYIEFRGIVRDSESYHILNLFIVNSTKENIKVYVTYNASGNKYSILVNRCDVAIGNCSVSVEKNSALLTGTDFKYLLQTKTFEMYEIDTVTHLEFSLDIERENSTVTVPFSLNVDIPLNDE